MNAEPSASTSSQPVPVQRGANRRKSAKPFRLPPAEREQLRAALHDGLGQLLTSMSFVAASLRQKLASKALPEVAEAEEIIALTGQAIFEAQALVAEERPPA